MGKRETTSIMCPDCEGKGFMFMPGNIQLHCDLCDGTGTYDEPHPTPPVSDDYEPVDLLGLELLINRARLQQNQNTLQVLGAVMNELRHHRAQAETWEREKAELVDALRERTDFTNNCYCEFVSIECGWCEANALLAKHTPVKQEGE